MNFQRDAVWALSLPNVPGTMLSTLGKLQETYDHFG